MSPLQDRNDLDRMSARELVELMNREDQSVARAVEAAADSIVAAIEAVTDRLRDGGRLFYVGAGTSGRIAMLDASELGPTYGIGEDLVQVIMAGGKDAFFRAVEGAEDSEEDAIAAVARLVRPADCVLGITASGSTPFTVAALRRANMDGALTVGLTSVAASPLARECDIPIVVETGPEVVLGSTRMKAGTAQKLVLNTISTAVMIALGHVHENLMIDMPATNAKLRERAIMMIRSAAGVDRAAALEALDACDGRVREAIVSARKGLPPEDARALLRRHSLREILEG